MITKVKKEVNPRNIRQKFEEIWKGRNFLIVCFLEKVKTMGRIINGQKEDDISLGDLDTRRGLGRQKRGKRGRVVR